MNEASPVRVHPTADVSAEASIGAGTSIWNQAQVRERARIGVGCVIGKNVYVDFDVVVGDRVKIQNNASLYHGVTVEDGVFIGPHVCFTNDRLPRAVNPDGSAKTDDDWEVGPIRVRTGAAVGASTRRRSGRDDRPMGAGGCRQRGDRRRRRLRARGRQPRAPDRQRLPVRRAAPRRAGRDRVPRRVPQLRPPLPAAGGCAVKVALRGWRPAAVREGRSGQPPAAHPPSRNPGAYRAALRRRDE